MKLAKKAIKVHQVKMDWSGSEELQEWMETVDREESLEIRETPAWMDR